MDDINATAAPVKSRKGIIIFLCLYGVLTALIVVGLFQLMNPLRRHLTAYEAAQLKNQSARIFDELFADPDWQEIYALSGTADTLYEGAEAYAAYMEAKVSGRELTCCEIYSPEPGVHQYQVVLGDEPIAVFTMTGGASSPADMPQWALGSVEIFFERRVGVTVEKRPEHTVYINGVALDDSFTIRTVETKAEKYLPEGVHGYRRVEQFVDGLLIQPEILVLDENGAAVSVVQDPETGIYTLQLPATAEMSEAEKTLARDAAIADAKFSMGAMTAAGLKKYFDEDAQVYADIVNNPISVQKNKGFSIDESAVQVGDFYRFSDEMFCANVKLTVNVTRKDDTLKKYELDKTYFFTRDSDGHMLVSAYTNEPVLERVEQVRLTFAVAGQRISIMTDSEADMEALPEVTAPDGQILTGWAERTDDGSGTITMTVRLLPTGAVLGALEPMTLYPVFQAAS
jgi:hypothetical protein